MPRHVRVLRQRLQTEALLVRKVPFGEADVVVTLFTEARGIISAVARAARRSSRRFPTLEPMHLLHAILDERSGDDLALLVETTLVRPRLGILGDLTRLEAAGRALRWVRAASPPHTPEPAIWVEVNGLLDALDRAETSPPPETRLAAMGLRLLVAIGWGLELERCVRCDRPCDPTVSATIDAGEGGLICRACGGGHILLRAPRRARLLDALHGIDSTLEPEDARAAIELVEAALAAHGS